MYTRFCFIIFLFTIVDSISAKELPKNYDVSINLSKGDLSKIKKSNELIKKGREIWDQLNSSYNPEEISSYKQDSICNKVAFPILLKAAKMLQDGNALKYGVFHNNCIDFWKKHKYDHPSGLEGAKKFQKEALSYVDSAALNRRVADNYTNQYVLAYNRFFEAISLEIIASKKEARALQIYLDWPAHYSYEWDEDVETNLFAAKPKKIEEKELVNIPDTLKFAPPLVVKDVKDSSIVYYSIQIAAHTIPLTDAQIRISIYKGPMLIREIWEDGWYKYLIGYFKNVNEAIELHKKINVEKAFVVAYKNGKRVPLKELNQPKPAGQ